MQISFSVKTGRVFSFLCLFLCSNFFLPAQEISDPCEKKEEPVRQPDAIGFCEENPDYQPTPGYTFNGGWNTTLPAGGGTLQNINYKISSTWTISAPTHLEFKNCNFLMDSGSKIEIILKVANIKFINCNFFSCTRMWAGIFVNSAQSDFILTFQDCRIEDAVTALDIPTSFNSNQIFNISGSTFLNNYTGVKNTPVSVSFPLLVCTKNYFTSNGNLRSVPSSLAGLVNTSIYPMAFAGLDISQVGLVLNITNTFSRMYYGILSKQNFLMVMDNHLFLSLFHDGINATNNYLIVDGNTFDSPSVLGGNDIATVNGIHAISSDVQALRNTFSGVLGTGIRSEINQSGEEIYINDNTFTPADYNYPDNCAFGIWLDRSAAAPSPFYNTHNAIYNNTITVDAINEYQGILVTGLNLSTDIMAVRDNQNLNFTHCRNETRAIRIWNSYGDNFRLLDNQTHIGGALNQGSVGMECHTNSSNGGHWVKDNVITGAISDYPTTETYSLRVGLSVIGDPININSSPRATQVCHNRTTLTDIGMSIPVGSADISRNRVGRHETGMSVGGIGPNGTQIGKGNIFDGVFINYAIRTANSSSPSSYNDRLFRVPEANTFSEIYTPAASLISPMPNVFTNNEWFKYDPNVSTSYCQEEDPLTDSDPKKLVTSTEQEIMQGTLALSPAELWDMQRKLYAKYLNDPAYSDQEEVIQFLSAYDGTSVHYFAEVGQMIRQATGFTSTEQEGMDQLGQQINSLSAELVELESVYGEEIVNLDSISLIPIRLKRNDISQHYTDMQAIRAVRMEQRMAALLAAKEYNLALATATSYEQARKTYNSVLINRLMNMVPNDADYQNLLDVVTVDDQMVAGLAGIDGQFLLDPCDQPPAKDPLGDRNSSAAPKKLPATGVQVFPNPSNGIFTLFLPANVGRIQISDLAGQTIREITINNTQEQQRVLDLSTTPAGVYFLTWYDQDQGRKETIKLLIQ